MRIIAGRYKGRRLSAPPGNKTRPTTDRDREAIFSALAHQLAQDFSGLAVLDLFAGSGLLGLEALSRGAAHATFVDKDHSAMRTIKANISTLKCEHLTRTFLGRADAAPRYESGYDLVFADAPYGSDLSAQAITSAQQRRLIKPGALCIVECQNKELGDLDTLACDILWQRARDNSAFTILQVANL
ncbi:MAG: 16S rRNA (guanine(966)-N(2))-methyltransferase RsmD [Pseudomonadota bacterium]